MSDDGGPIALAPVEAPAPPEEPPPPPADDQPRRKFRFPTAFTVLAIVLLLVWIASFFVPPGTYKKDVATGGPVPGTYSKLPACSAAAAGVQCADTSFTFRFKQLWDSPPNGLYGVEGATGFVSSDELGFLYGSAAIFFFVLALRAVITVTMKTGAIQTGIGRLALRYRSSGAVLIAILMTVFALGGTSYGMWEET